MMQWLYQMKIKAKLFGGFGAVTLLILANGMMNHGGLNQINQASQVAASASPLVNAVTNMEVSTHTSMRMIMEFMNAPTEADLEPLQQAVIRANEKFSRYSQEILNGSETVDATDHPEIRGLIEQSAALYQNEFSPRVQAVYEKQLQILQSVSKKSIAKTTMDVGVRQIMEVSDKLDVLFKQLIAKKIEEGASAEEILYRESIWLNLSKQIALAVANSRVVVEKYVQADLAQLDAIEAEYKRTLEEFDGLVKPLSDGGTVDGFAVPPVDIPEIKVQVVQLNIIHDQLFQMGNTILMQFYKAGLVLEAEIDVLNRKAVEVGGALIALVEKTEVIANEEMKQAQAMAEETASSIQVQAIWTILLVLILSMVISTLISKSITVPLKELSVLFQNITSRGDFSLRSNSSSSRNEIGRMGRAVNELLENLQAAINESNRVVGDVAHGVFSSRIDADFKGDLTTLKEGVNNSAESVERTMQGLTEVMHAITNGEFSYRLDSEDMEEGFRELLTETMETMEAAINEINQAMAAASRGDFTQRVQSDLRGDLDNLKQGVNQSLQNIQHALDEAGKVADAIASGNLSKRVEGQYYGRLGDLKGSLNESTEQLHRIVSQVNISSEQVGSNAKEVNTSSDQLARRTAQQAASLEETAASMEEMTATVQHNAENAGVANQLSADAHSEAAEGSEVVDQAVEAVARIKESSDKITEIISLIDGIAFQTNLLALNAAVEAARAGEQGRGFAVVAGEVRTLAQRSAAAAKDISALIEESSHRVNEGAELVGNAGTALTRIQTAVQKVNNIIKEISTSSNEQSLSIQQVNTAISELEGVNQQNSAMVEESAAASSQLDQQARKLVELMRFFDISAVTTAVKNGTVETTEPEIPDKTSVPKEDGDDGFSDF